MEYAQLRGTLDGMDTTVITEIADYYRTELGEYIAPRTPFVGEYFNVTRAGVHADGLMKDEEIYNVFNTGLLLNRPPKVMITNTSGAAGIAHWINSTYNLKDEARLTKESPVVTHIKDWVDQEYAGGRVTAISDSELLDLTEKYSAEYGIRLR